MKAFMYPATSRALLAQSRAFTQAKRQEREQAKAFAEALSQFKELGWKDTGAAELAAIHVGVQQ